ncbi:MAG TPA: response regulator [Oxalicibacterium sp.]|nr:response regulator [Oxalicibacterium sp.]
MARDPYKYFRIEAQELIDQLNRGALELEKGGAGDSVASLLRLAHTLKGAARVVKQTDIGNCAHAIEDTLAPLRESGQPATQSQIDAVLKQLDCIAEHLASLAVPAPTSVMASAEERTTAHPSRSSANEDILRTVRVEVGEMDTLLDGFDETHARLGPLRERVRKTSALRSKVDSLGNDVAAARLHGKDAGSSWRMALDQIAGDLGELQRTLASDIEALERELMQVRDTAERMRLIAADSLFVALERAVRDAAQVQGKKVIFESRGGDVRLDAQVLGAVQGALSHVVRNAVTHGIEDPIARQAAGKPAEGRVVVHVAQRGRWIEFICSDDGGGIDLVAVRRIAQQRGLEASALNDDALLRLLTQGSISTAETVSEVAGRGVGLDVVRDAAERLDGKLALRTEAGKGTSVTLTVPLLISSLDGLRVEAGGTLVTLPMDAVRATLRIGPAEIVRTPQGESVLHQGSAIPFLQLARLLSNESAMARTSRAALAVVIEARDGMAAIGVERLLGAVNIVVRPLPVLAPAAPFVSGASINAEGNPQWVLDARHLVLAAQRAVAASEEDDMELPILVVDDSLTTRMLERSILESAGYAVQLAVSAEEALEKLADTRYGLILVDVEMPGMDGFSFIERIRAHPEWREIPAILVTSLASDAHRQRGRDVGAQDYIVKSEFDQGALLQRIDQLMTEAVR